ncbi:hypothetical protein [Embleya hyalina]|uniref:J domain-containing protein n=1 Tax=Embleya hyalina TaxID=516124 RepID=A0A401YUJ7_9ACTN|nr:hypothetical protein [Embleya hyalina]GCD98308.1 hypothetical protein EHYA_06012 [Embleya hyalina]
MDEVSAPTPWSDPEIAELERQVAAEETALLDDEVDVTTLQVELDNLAIVHHRRLGPLYERLDELDALIAEAIAAHTGDPADIRRAVELRGVVTDMPDLDSLLGALDGAPGAEGGSAEESMPVPEVHRVSPGAEARKLFRELARRAHPDLVQDAEEKQRRGAFIARVNAAYARGDVTELLALGTEWATSPEGASGPGTEGRGQWLRSRLAWLTHRRTELAGLREELMAGAMGQLLQLAPQDPDGLLEHLADQLLHDIAEKEKVLGTLVP